MMLSVLVVLMMLSVLIVLVAASIGSCIGSKQPGYLKGTRRKPSRTKRMVSSSY